MSEALSQFENDYSVLGNGYRNVFYSTKKEENGEKHGEITLMGYDKDGTPETFKFPYRVSAAYWIVGDSTDTGEKDLYGRPLRRKFFNTSYERRQWLKAMEETPSILVVEAFPPEDAFLMDAFGHRIYDDDYNHHPQKVYFFDIEIAVENEFPFPDQAAYPINIITLFDSIGRKYYSWALSDTHFENTLPTHDDCPVELFKFGNEKARVDLEYKFAKGEITESTLKSQLKLNMQEAEKKMLKHFVSWCAKNPPSVWSGWNCLNKNSNIWMPDGIVKLGRVTRGQRLVDSTVLNVFPTEVKDEYKVHLENGNDIFTSKDHIFPVKIAKSDKYICYNVLGSNHEDRTVEEMSSSMKHGNEVFVKVPIHNNTNDALTWRDYILYDLEGFLSKFDIVLNKFSDSRINANIVAGYRYYSKLKDICSLDQVKEYINNHSSIKVYANKKIHIDVNLDEAIPCNLFHVLGIVYTDGSYDRGSEKRKSSFVIYNTDKNIINNVADTLDVYRKRAHKDKLFKKNAEGVYRYRFSHTTPISLLSRMIFSSTSKCLDVELLSRLSRNQFDAFFAGLIDGDGWISQNSEEICFCNYNNDIRKVHELLLWNGVFSTISDRWLRIGVCDKIAMRDRMNLWSVKKHNRFNRFTYRSHSNTTAKAGQTRYRIGSDHAFVRVKSIERTGKKVEMVDIETDTHYFIANGIKTHNCRAFDMPYIIRRMENVLDKKWAEQLCPGGYYRAKKLIHEEDDSNEKKKPNRLTTVYMMSGVSQMDLQILYRDKFKIHSALDGGYSLNNVSLTELDDEKVKHEESFNNFWKVNFQKYWEYNVQDVSLVMRLEEKLGLIDQARNITSIGSTNQDSIYQSINYIMQSLAMFARNKFGKTWQTHLAGGKKKGEKYTGAFVFDVQAGVYRYGEATVDFNSLYPNTGRSLNLSPETKMAVVYGDWDDPDETIYIVPNEYVWPVSPKAKKALMEAKALGHPGVVLKRETLAKLLDTQCATSVKIVSKEDGSIRHVLFRKYEIQKGIFSEWLGFYFDRRKGLKKILAQWEDKADAIEEEVIKRISSDGEHNSCTEKEIKKLAKSELRSNDEYKHCLNMADRYDHLQQATKILINSAYGTLGTTSSPIYDVDLAETITLNGQFTNKSAAKEITRIYKERFGAPDDFVPQLSGDTDSVTGDMTVCVEFSQELASKIKLQNKGK